jgi:hypothetical protein
MTHPLIPQQHKGPQGWGSLLFRLGLGFVDVARVTLLGLILVVVAVLFLFILFFNSHLAHRFSFPFPQSGSLAAPIISLLPSLLTFQYVDNVRQRVWFREEVLYARLGLVRSIIAGYTRLVPSSIHAHILVVLIKKNFL